MEDNFTLEYLLQMAEREKWELSDNSELIEKFLHKSSKYGLKLTMDNIKFIQTIGIVAKYPNIVKYICPHIAEVSSHFTLINKTYPNSNYITLKTKGRKMKKMNLTLHFIFIYLLGLSICHAQIVEKFVPGELIIELKYDLTITSTENGVVKTDRTWFNKHAAKTKCSNIKPLFRKSSLRKIKYYKMEFDPTVNLDSLIVELKKENEILSIRKNHQGEYCGTDPLASSQWGLAKIKASQAWSTESGSSDVILAIIDSGIDLGDPDDSNPDPHDDISGNLWNENNTYGYDIEEYPLDYEPYDEIGHGTRVAGIAGAVTNNSTGIAGVAGGGHNGDDGVTLLIIKSAVNETDVAASIELAVDEGADIINLSMAWSESVDCTTSQSQSTDPVQIAINDAIQNDVVVIAAIGNNKGDLSADCPKYWLTYPAHYSGVISVAGLDSSDSRGGTSNYADWCDISAPGEDILTTYPSHLDSISPIGYETRTASSYAAPFVSGVAALIRSYAPLADRDMVEDILKETSDDVDQVNDGEDWEDKLGSGRVNADEALGLISDNPATPQNFSVSFPHNQNPVLTWSANSEADLKGYKVYKKYITSSGTNTVTVSTTSTSHTDTYFTSNKFTGQDEVEYWIKAEDIVGNLSSETSHISGDGTSNYQQKVNSKETDNQIKTYELFSNYPNPFNPSTKIKFQIPVSGFVNLTVYNSLGQEVATLVNTHKEMGQYETEFHSGDLTSGFYFYKLESNNFRAVKKMLILK